MINLISKHKRMNYILRIVMALFSTLIISLIVEVLFFNSDFFRLETSDKGSFEISNYSIREGQISVDTDFKYIDTLKLTVNAKSDTNVTVKFNSKKLDGSNEIKCIRHTNYTTSSLKTEPPHRSLRTIPSLLESHL